MPTLPAKVLPGDLITSDCMNLIMDVCADLQQRVRQLEQPSTSTAGLRIDSLLPTGVRHIGDPIHIIGSGFDAPTGTVVTIDGIGVQTTQGADRDRELVVTIPNVQGVTSIGKNVTLVVTNSRGTDTTDFVVFPAVNTSPQGQIFPVLTQAPNPASGRLESGQSYTFVYTTQFFSNLDEDYLLTGVTDLGWTATIVDGGDNPASSQIRVPASPPPAGTSQTIRVRVSIPTGVPNGTEATLQLVVTSVNNPLRFIGRSGGDLIRVNGAPPPPMDVGITRGGVIRTVATQALPSTNGVVRIGPSAENYRIGFSAQVRANTVYSVTLSAPGNPPWFASLSGASSPVLQMNIGPVPAPTDQTVNVFIHANAGAADAELTLTLTSTTDPTKFGRIIQPIGLLS